MKSAIAFALMTAVFVPSAQAASTFQENNVNVGWTLVAAGDAFNADVAPSSQTPPLQEDFGGTDLQRSYISTFFLTPSGYPWGTIIARVPACEDPTHAKEAMDAWNASDVKWMNSLSDCVILGEGLKVEWTKYNDDFQLGQTTVRLKEPDGSRATFYIPAMKDGAVLDWPLTLTAWHK